jgi:hypothetical protein
VQRSAAVAGRLRASGTEQEDPSTGPAYRVVYRLLEAKRTGVRVVQVLGVGRAHVRVGEEDIYTSAATLRERLNWRTP